MSTATAENQTENQTETKSPVEGKTIRYTPIGSTEEIEISMGAMSHFIANKTKKGVTPSTVDLVRFMMLCKANQLNPWTGDAYLVGYDTTDGAVFNMIVAAQAFYKRAELNKDFDGIEGGVIIRNSRGEIEYRQGDFYIAEERDEVLLGGWARVYRKNISKPVYEALRLSVYSTGKSRWAIDPGGMISKCAKVAALRKALPNTLSEYYTKEEMDHVIESHTAENPQVTITSSPQPRSIREMAVRSKAESAADTGKEPVKDTVKEQAKQTQPETVKAEPNGFQSYLKKIGGTAIGDSDAIEAMYHEIAMDDALSQAQRDELVSRLNAKTEG